MTLEEHAKPTEQLLQWSHGRACVGCRRLRWKVRGKEGLELANRIIIHVNFFYSYGSLVYVAMIT